MVFRSSRAAAIAAAGFGAAAALSQSVIDPTLLDRQQRESKRLQEERERLLAPRRPIVESPLMTPPPPVPEGIRFVLRQVDFGPSRFLQAAELDALAAPLLGKEIDFAGLNALVERVNALYQAKGQAFSRAILPPQRVADGRIRIDLVEAKASGVSIDGRKYIDETWVRGVVGVQDGETIDATRLETSIERFQRASEARFNVEAEPGAEQGSTRLKVGITEPQRLAVQAFLANDGSDSTGREQGGVDLRLFSPLGRGDRAGLGVIYSRGLQSLNLSYTAALNARGTRATYTTGMAQTKIINGPFAAADIRGESTSWGAQLAQPLWDARPWMAEGYLSYSSSHSESSISGIDLGTSRTRQPGIGVQLSWRDLVAEWSGVVTWSHVRAIAPVGATTDSAKLDWSTSYVHRYPERGALLLRANGQTLRSSNGLPGAAQFSLGGAGTLRAYPSGVLSGDSGYVASAEWHAAASETLGWNVFAERGAVWSGGMKRTLGDIGAGLEWRWNEKTSVSGTVARAFNELPDVSKHRLYVRISTEF
jgi:hemolysin activation/secretion protein